MSVAITNIITFLTDLSGTDKINPGSDIFQDIGMAGDDFHEMIEKYSKQFSVDMDDYLWYFHTNEEGRNSLGGAFFKPPYKRVKRIPITPLMLSEFADKGKWEIDYPEHILPKRRNDLLLNRIVLAVFLLCMIIWMVVKFMS